MTSAKSPQVRLRHIVNEIDAIVASTTGLSAEAIKQDYLTLRAIERAIQIISEAAKELPIDLRRREPNVPWSAVIGIGNMLRHEYYRIDADAIRVILFEHLPELRPAIVRLLAQYES